MAWQTAKKRYEDGSTEASQSVEDAVARQMLAGMGLKTDQLSRAERAFHIAYDEDKAMYPRVLELFAAVSRMCSGRIRGLIDTPGSLERAHYYINVVPYCKKDRADVIEMFNAWAERNYCDPAKNIPMIAMTRPKGPAYRGMAFAYLVVRPDSQFDDLVRPPFSVIAEINGGQYWLVETPVKQLVHDFTGWAVSERINDNEQ